MVKYYFPKELVEKLIQWIKDQFVQKDGSKQLSDNNYTDTDKNKVDNIPHDAKYTDTTYGVATNERDGLLSSGNYQKLNSIEEKAQVNRIEVVKRNGTIVAVGSDKAVDIKVPTKLSDLTNDNGFQTASEVRAIVQDAGHIKKEITSQRPSTGEDNVIYLVPTQGGSENVYDEWMYIGGKWEKIGDTTTTVDLSNHWSKTELTAMTEQELNELLTL